jgi:hypothetical protein
MPPSQYALDNPFATDPTSATAVGSAPSLYDEDLQMGAELLERSKRGGGLSRVMVQHEKKRMTVWERIKVLTEHEPNILWQNWGKNLDGASIVTGILNIRTPPTAPSSRA